MEIVLALAAGVSLLLLAWQHRVARAFPVHERRVPLEGSEAVTILKPLRGVDATTRECLESWVRQEHEGPMQILFGVESAEDPAVALVETLRTDHPDRDIRMVVCPERPVPNPKVAMLLQMESCVTTPWVVIADADVRAPADLLRQELSRLRNPSVGLVYCLFRVVSRDGWPGRVEELLVNADFWGQVLQGRSLGRIQFALGAVVMTRRSALASIGGLARVGHHLADDYELGRRMGRAGLRVELATVVVDCLVPPGLSWGTVWRRQLRWARTIRFCQPVPYAFSILANATLWPVLWGIAMAGSSLAPGLLLAATLLRLAVARGLHRRMTGGRSGAGIVWCMPGIDLLRAVIWAFAWIGRGVVWQDRRYRVTAGGRLVAVGSGSARRRSRPTEAPACVAATARRETRTGDVLTGPGTGST